LVAGIRIAGETVIKKTFFCEWGEAPDKAFFLDRFARIPSGARQEAQSGFVQSDSP
jgi:hypothetical protein